jgi:hypothetical protein
LSIISAFMQANCRQDETMSTCHTFSNFTYICSVQASNAFAITTNTKNNSQDRSHPFPFSLHLPLPVPLLRSIISHCYSLFQVTHMVFNMTRQPYLARLQNHGSPSWQPSPPHSTTETIVVDKPRLSTSFYSSQCPSISCHS